MSYIKLFPEIVKPQILNIGYHVEYDILDLNKFRTDIDGLIMDKFNNTCKIHPYGQILSAIQIKKKGLPILSPDGYITRDVIIEVEILSPKDDMLLKNCVIDTIDNEIIHIKYNDYITIDIYSNILVNSGYFDYIEKLSKGDKIDVYILKAKYMTTRIIIIGTIFTFYFPRKQLRLIELTLIPNIPEYTIDKNNNNDIPIDKMDEIKDYELYKYTHPNSLIEQNYGNAATIIELLTTLDILDNNSIILSDTFKLTTNEIKMLEKYFIIKKSDGDIFITTDKNIDLKKQKPRNNMIIKMTNTNGIYDKLLYLSSIYVSSYIIVSVIDHPSKFQFYIVCKEFKPNNNILIKPDDIQNIKIKNMDASYKKLFMEYNYFMNNWSICQKKYIKTLDISDIKKQLYDSNFSTFITKLKTR